MGAVPHVQLHHKRAACGAGRHGAAARPGQREAPSGGAGGASGERTRVQLEEEREPGGLPGGPVECPALPKPAAAAPSPTTTSVIFSLLSPYPLHEQACIMGHSMGGHGALTIALKNPAAFKSVSVFAPICNPTQVSGVVCQRDGVVSVAGADGLGCQQQGGVGGVGC